MTFDRRTVQIVEIDIEACDLTFGTGACTAGFGGVELVTNGTFDSDVSGWTGSSGSTLSWNSGAMLITNAPADPFGGGYQTITTVAGKTYITRYDVVSASGTWSFRVNDGSSPGNSQYSSGGMSGTGSFYAVWVAASSQSTLYAVCQDSGGTLEVDNITTPFPGDTVRKCYNTWATCRLAGAERSTVFDTVTKTLRFAQNQNGLPKGTKIYPALAGPVSTNPASVNLGGINEKVGALGKRARVTINFKDFTDSDIGLDKYQTERKTGTAQTDEGGYDPFQRGTFFGKLRQRFPYYEGRALRVLEGYEGEALASMRTRNYVISEWSGPDANGNVSITAKDVLDLADNKKALCPSPSRGKLEEDIEDDFLGDVTLIPETIGDEYAASGRISIGSEIMTFTRSGDTLTITERAVDGSEAASHSRNDLVQQCYHVSKQTIPAIAADLLENYAGINAAWLPTTDWADEADRWLASFNLTTTIAKPTGVTTLMGELSQFGVMFWWDDIAQEVKMRPNRPLEYNEVAPSLTDGKNVLAGSLSSEDMEDQRISRVILWHGNMDMSGFSDDGSNFARAFVAIDPEAETDMEYNQERTLEIFTRWLGTPGNDGIANAVATRLLNRYRTTPRQITFSVDIKDDASIDVASAITLTSRTLQDDTGASLPTEMQITALEEVLSGHRMQVTAQTFQFSGRYGNITENSRSDYTASTDEEKAKGTYIVDENILVFADGTGPYLMF